MLNRLLDAFYKIPGSSVTNSYNEHLTYDLNGNILSLKRNGEKETEQFVIMIDDLDGHKEMPHLFWEIKTDFRRPKVGRLWAARANIPYNTKTKMKLTRNIHKPFFAMNFKERFFIEID